MGEKVITEADLLAAMRAQAHDEAMGMPHPFSERRVADLWFRLPAAPVPPVSGDLDALREAAGGLLAALDTYERYWQTSCTGFLPVAQAKSTLRAVLSPLSADIAPEPTE